VVPSLVCRADQFEVVVILYICIFGVSYSGESCDTSDLQTGHLGMLR
jgi:hypothetical protein